MPTGLNKSREELPWLYYPRSNSVRVINSHLDGGGGFVPTDIANLWCWLDASDSATVLNTISPDVSATDGQVVRRWVDKSGNANHAEQATAGLQPTLDADGISSLPAILFDATDDCFTMPSIDAANVTAFVVLKTTKALFVVFSDSATEWFLIVQDGSSSTSLADTIDNIANYRADGVAVSPANRDGMHTAIATGNTVVVTVQNLDLTGFTSLKISAYSGPLQFSGHIAEIVIYTADLTTEQRDQVESYLLNKW